MQIIERLKPWLGRKSVRGAIIVMVIIIAVIYYSSNGNETVAELEVQNPVVKLTNATEYAGGQSLSLVGNVRAFTEAQITSERAGRVVSVNASLGQQVSAGAVLATLENASERASVLQAEGVYDAAVAAAAQSNVGVNEAQNGLRTAQNNAVSAFKSAYNTTNGIVINSIDAFFSDPTNKNVPGLRIDGKGFTSQLNSERVALQTILSTWQTKTNTISAQADLDVELEYASQNVQKIINMVDTFLLIFSQQDNGSRYTEAELQSFSTSFTGLRSTLIGVQSSIDTAEAGLSSARDAVKRSELSAQGGTTSSADAQVKQALGSLRSAQANLAKTILRTPISGTVNSLSIRTGDFINSFTQVAIVANNNALEVVTYISDSEKNLIKEGDVVLIDGKYEGTVTEIAPAVDSATRKTEVRIATEGTDIVNGDTVRITKEVSLDEAADGTVKVPLTAVKFERENGSMFIIEDKTLVSKPVVLGNVLGNSVEILEGITKDDLFVVDTRGLVAGEEVEIQN
ncbi:HlyD family efflux transporter periplasmic adaptor subunit [Candidatus Nomurabacteria bacterium]|nr:HlyD family efflux transporter periplasmic adaptor subunit [Candidatus Nomurabacteria bacterium]MCB9818169.1 HlyD family efflux transporter periplasmic adaptor subunit [Candidatus Nomurabacteria bacterium]